MRALSQRYGLEVDPEALVEDLPVGIQQRVEIIKALVRDASVLILDEPTAVLTPAETEDLFRIIRRLKDGGTSVVFISHKLKEVQAIADTITVLRRGAVVGQKSPSASEDELAAIRIYTQQLGVELRAVNEAREAVRVYTNQYQGGLVDLTTVVTAEATLLTDEQNALTARQNLFIASVALIEALGGGWDVSQLPTPAQVSVKPTKGEYARDK